MYVHVCLSSFLQKKKAENRFSRENEEKKEAKRQKVSSKKKYKSDNDNDCNNIKTIH